MRTIQLSRRNKRLLEIAERERQHRRGQDLAHSIQQEKKIKKNMNTKRVSQMFGRRRPQIKYKGRRTIPKKHAHVEDFNDYASSSSNSSHHSFVPKNSIELMVKNMHNKNRTLRGKMIPMRPGVARQSFPSSI